jgi:ATP-dependent helicase Lhr and Lhr-like helicase
LVAARRATRAVVDGRGFWVATERVKSFALLFPSAVFETSLPEIGAAVSHHEALLAALTGWMAHIGPCTAPELAELLGMPESEIDRTLLRMEGSGAILRGQFTVNHPGTTEWCERRLLARIHRLTVGKLRNEIQPVSAAQFLHWLLRWQHVSQGTKCFGERGMLEVLRQLQGFEAPSNAWERQILRVRIADYNPKVLDRLCLTGAVGWGRLSPHPATARESSGDSRRVVPTSAAPITFFVREDADWMEVRNIPKADEGTRGLSANGREVLKFLEQRGASFFADIVRGTRKLKSEVETALWELVAVGMITADDFDNLRALIDPRRRAGRGPGRIARPRHSGGRWSVLNAGEPLERTAVLGSTCSMLLRRYGVVFRDLIERESIIPKWRELLMMFRRLEDRGEIRGGRFVSGFLGEQFALPAAVESLRATSKQERSGEMIAISAADPLNLAGILVPGERVPANSGRVLVLRDGIPVAADEVAVPRSIAVGT